MKSPRVFSLSTHSLLLTLLSKHRCRGATLEAGSPATSFLQVCACPRPRVPSVLVVEARDGEPSRDSLSASKPDIAAARCFHPGVSPIVQAGVPEPFGPARPMPPQRRAATRAQGLQMMRHRTRRASVGGRRPEPTPPVGVRWYQYVSRSAASFLHSAAPYTSLRLGK